MGGTSRVPSGPGAPVWPVRPPQRQSAALVQPVRPKPQAAGVCRSYWLGDLEHPLKETHRHSAACRLAAAAAACRVSAAVTPNLPAVWVGRRRWTQEVLLVGWHSRLCGEQGVLNSTDAGCAAWDLLGGFTCTCLTGAQGVAQRTVTYCGWV